jgi:hypothetical protein
MSSTGTRTIQKRKVEFDGPGAALMAGGCTSSIQLTPPTEKSKRV